MHYRAPMGGLRFDVFGRYEIDVERRGDRWLVYLRGEGKRREHPTLVIPSEIPEDGLAGYLEDVLHEEGTPGRPSSASDNGRAESHSQPGEDRTRRDPLGHWIVWGSQQEAVCRGLRNLRAALRA
jgi:hypothetical protein